MKIPSKYEIEMILGTITGEVRYADKITDIEDWLASQLVSLECHVANRAGVERGEIEE